MKRASIFTALVWLVGCGGASPEQPFTGTWSFDSGSDNVSCPNGTTTVPLRGNLTVKPAVGGGLVVLDAEGCNFTYAVSGSEATLTGKNECSFPAPELGQGVTADATYDAITLSTSDGQTLRDTFSGKVSYTASSGKLDCVFSGAATLTKSSNQ